MLKQLLHQVNQYEQRNLPSVAFDTVGMIVTRLYQVDASQLKDISAEELRLLTTKLLSFANNATKQKSLFVYCDQALLVLERFREVNATTALMDFIIKNHKTL